MANVALPGFIPVAKGGLTVELERKRVLTNNTTAIFKGDALDATSSGDVIVTASTTTDLYSVQWGGASYISGGDRIERRYLPATTTYTSTTVDPANCSYVYAVVDMVSTEFQASSDAAIAQTDVGINYAMVLGTGSTTTGLSAHTLATSGRGTSATLPWRVIDFVRGDPKSDPDTTLCHMRCLANAGDREPALEPGGSLGT
jgi:hypothetical protein